MINSEIERYKQTLRHFLNGYGEDAQNAIVVALTLLDRESAVKAISIEGVSSQACPICHMNVNNSYCPSCGHRIKY